MYCGTDSVLGPEAAEKVAGSLGAKIHTLQDALRTWRMRVVLLGIGVIALALPMAGLATLVWVALSSAV